MNSDETSWENSECADGWYHRFNITNQFDGCLEETCELCGRQAYFMTIDGRSNNDIYLAHHIRQCLPPYHPLFKREYSNTRFK